MNLLTTRHSIIRCVDVHFYDNNQVELQVEIAITTAIFAHPLLQHPRYVILHFDRSSLARFTRARTIVIRTLSLESFSSWLEEDLQLMQFDDVVSPDKRDYFHARNNHDGRSTHGSLAFLSSIESRIRFAR